jgi:hypothetical protein
MKMRMTCILKRSSKVSTVRLCPYAASADNTESDWIRSHKVFLRWKTVQRETGPGAYEDTVAFQYDPANVRDLQADEAVIIQFLSVPNRIQLRRIREEDADRVAGQVVIPRQMRVIPAATEAGSSDSDDSDDGPPRVNQRAAARASAKATKKQRKSTPPDVFATASDHLLPAVKKTAKKPAARKTKVTKTGKAKAAPPPANQGSSSKGKAADRGPAESAHKRGRSDADAGGSEDGERARLLCLVLCCSTLLSLCSPTQWTMSTRSCASSGEGLNRC